MKPFRYRASGLAIITALGFMPIKALAADADASQKQPTEVGEVIVTAQKTAQKLQDVPISISAVTKQELEQRNVTDLTAMESSIPGLSSDHYGPGIDFVQIRGVSNSLGAPTVGNYLDEMPTDGTIQQNNIDIRLLDMDRIEVLRGPQGTLYGEGSMGGTIRYITSNPNLEDYYASVEGELSSTEGGGTGYKANAVLSAPLIKDVLGVRLVVGDEHDAGWIDNTVTGQKNINGADFKTYRAKILFEPTPDTKITVLALHQDLTQANQNFGDDGKVAAFVPTFDNSRYDLFNGVLNQNLGFADLTESLGYLHNNAASQFDITDYYLPVLIYYGLTTPGAITAIGDPTTIDTKVFTNETRLTSKPGGPFNWTLGYYYRWSDTGENDVAYTKPGSLPVPLLVDLTDLKSKAWAVFGEASYQFTPQLTGTIGLRYFEDQRNQNSFSDSLGSAATNINAGKFTSLDPRFNLRYEFSPDSMVYFNAAKGFRSGGFNLTSAGGGVYTVPPSYGPDSIWSYEVGTKQELFDRKLEIQAAVYYESWKAVQSYEFAPGSPVVIVANAGNAEGWGTDLQAAWHATPNLDLTASYGWNNLHFVGNLAQAIAEGTDKYPGDPVDFAVHDSGSASLYYHVPIGANTAFLRLDYLYAGKSQITLRNFGNEINYNPARTNVNARIGMNIDRYEVSLFVNNLTNDKAPIITGPFGVISTNVEQQPLTAGINFKAHW